MSFLTAAVQGANGQRPSFRQDFTRTTVLDPRITFTRNSPSWGFNSAGIYTQVGVNQPVFDYDQVTLQPRGLRIWEASMNYIANSTMAGAVVGVVGSGGLLPTGWAFLNNAGLTMTILAIGSEQGLNYLDIRANGVTTSAGQIVLYHTQAYPAATVGQSWAASAYYKLLAGNFNSTNVSNLRIVDRSSTTSYLYATGVDLKPMTSNFTRYTYSRALATAGTSYVGMDTTFTFNEGQSVDFTFRIAAPQLEQKSFATPFIPTSNSTVTREGDSAIMSSSNFTSWYNQYEGTPVVEFTRSIIGGPNVQGRFITIGGHLGSIALETGYAAPDQQRFSVTDVDGSTSAILTTTLNATAGTIYRMAASYKQDQFRVSSNGGTVLSDNDGKFSTQFAKIGLGSSGTGGNFLNGHIRYFAYYPKALPDQVQKLSSLI